MKIFRCPEYKSLEELISASYEHKQRVLCATLSEDVSENERKKFLVGKIVDTESPSTWLGIIKVLLRL